jgi:hypothetical protein
LEVEPLEARIVPTNPRVGYYDERTFSDNNDAYIRSVGADPVRFTGANELTAANLNTLNALIIALGNGSRTGTLMNNIQNVFNWVQAGGDLIIHDSNPSANRTQDIVPGLNVAADGSDLNQHFFGLNHSPYGGSNTMDVFPGATSPILNGPFGTVNNATMDGGNHSNHGFITADKLPAGVNKVMTWANNNTTRAAVISYGFGQGSVIYTTLPAEHYTHRNYWFFPDYVQTTNFSNNLNHIYLRNELVAALDGAVAPPQNLAPTQVSANGPYNIREDQNLSLNATATDPDTPANQLTYSWDVNGDGVFGDAEGQNPILNQQQRANLGIIVGNFNVRVRVNDGQNTLESAAAALGITPAPPQVDPLDDINVFEGFHLQQEAFFFSSATSWTGTVHYGDSPDNVPLQVDQDNRSFVLDHVFADNGVFDVTVRITDELGQFDEETFRVNVQNAPPAVILNPVGNQPANPPLNPVPLNGGLGILNNGPPAGVELEPISSSDDQVQTVDLAFAFPFLGQVFNQVSVSSNGILFLGQQGTGDYTPSPEEFAEYGAAIGGYWTDLYPGVREESGVYFNSSPNQASFTWYIVPSYGNRTDSHTFRIDLFADGTIALSWDGITLPHQHGQNILIGISPPQPPQEEPVLFAAGQEVDFSTVNAPTNMPPAIHELFQTMDEFGDPFEQFDLDGQALVFFPNGLVGWNVQRVGVFNGNLPTEINEGDLFEQTGFFTDPGVNDAPWEGTVDYGDGTGVQPLQLNADKTFNLSHTYTQSGVYDVIVTVTDKDGGVGVSVQRVVVNNVVPVVSLANGVDAPEVAGPIEEGQVFEGQAQFVDPGAENVWKITIDYGDGNVEVRFVNATGLIDLSHQYDLEGNYNVLITVDDGEGASNPFHAYTVIVLPANNQGGDEGGVGDNEVIVIDPNQGPAQGAVENQDGEQAIVEVEPDPNHQGPVIVVIAAFVGNPVENAPPPPPPPEPVLEEGEEVVVQTDFYDIRADGALTLTITFPIVPGAPFLIHFFLVFDEDGDGAVEDGEGSWVEYVPDPNGPQPVISPDGTSVTIVITANSIPTIGQLGNTVFSVSVATPTPTPTSVTPGTATSGGASFVSGLGRPTANFVGTSQVSFSLSTTGGSQLALTRGSVDTTTSTAGPSVPLGGAGFSGEPFTVSSDGSALPMIVGSWILDVLGHMQGLGITMPMEGEKPAPPPQNMQPEGQPAPQAKPAAPEKPSADIDIDLIFAELDDALESMETTPLADLEVLEPATIAEERASMDRLVWAAAVPTLGLAYMAADRWGHDRRRKKEER